MKSGVWQGGARMPPAIDGRDLAALVSQMKAMAPHYTPEWRFSPDDPDAGTALFYLVAEMLQDNIKRLNRVPLSNLIAFLDMLQVRLRPARPARATVVFALNEGAREPVYIPSGTRLTANATDGGEDVPFETDAALLITPAKLTDWVNVHPGRDRIVWMADDCEAMTLAGENVEPALFDVTGNDLQEHVLYFRHDELFLLDRPARVTLAWHNAERRYAEPELARAMARTDWLEWAWFGDDGWIPFDRAQAERREMTLWKTKAGPLRPTEVNGSEGRWIRCRVKPDPAGGNASPALSAIPEMDRVTFRAAHDAERDPDGIRPSALFFNDLELDAAGFYPFGEQFVPYSLFHISCAEAFTKKGSRLRLSFLARNVGNVLRNAPDPEVRWKMIMRTADFEPKPPERVAIRRVQWEYWNGEVWARVPESGIYETMFAELPEEEASLRFAEFPCPEDWSPTFVNGSLDWWLRVRVLATDPIAAPMVEYMSPWLERLTLTYGHGAETRLQPWEAVTRNNAEWTDRTATVRQGGTAFKPFAPIDCPAPAAYWGFDLPPVKGPIRLHYTLGKRPPVAGEPPWIEWEALVKEPGGWRWAPLNANDETNGYTQSGSIQFVGPPGLAPARQFGRERAWLRAVNRDGYYGALGAALPTVRRVDRNAVPAVQRSTIRDELPEETRDGYVLSRMPVVAQEVWVDETGFLGEQALAELDEERYEAVRDTEGKIGRLWVRWEEVDSLAGSGGGDRHYTIDSATGFIRFGDGSRGMAPPNQGAGKIRVTYQVTEGARGNVGSGEIAGLLQSVAFVGGVRNPAPAVGGGDAETLEQALRRGPQQLRHQGRAVSAADVEWIVREADPSIAKVRCLPNRNARLERETGTVAVVALPQGGPEGIAHFPESKRKIEQALRSKAPNLVGRTGRLAVLAPALLEISVAAAVTVSSAELILPVESACLAKLDAFLDTMKGQLDEEGWEIGETVHVSLFYGLLHSVRGVQTVESLHLSVVCIENGEAKEIPPGDMARYPHGIVVPGRHKLTVTLDI
ncbi:baseplate J/gp47 family protein [Paenibacillaceae bacterium WGS1546]|uniref:baseplate J/gp47 family protein n=1 Tax=Cohnella sp. WGS1546 TaxID=3366810 RepID=UPI00372D7536